MFVEIIQQAVMITSFVFVMMLLIEYLNVETSGRLETQLHDSRFRQYLLASFLGATPGCLGAFTVVSLFEHRVVGFGALVAAMIATSGDEAYVMFSLFPRKALLLTLALLAIGMVSGYLTDLFFKRWNLSADSMDHPLPLHAREKCRCFQRETIFDQLRNISFPRTLLLLLLGGLLVAILEGSIGPHTWNWVRVTILAGDLFALFVAFTVPDHFLQEHLWEHVLKRHLLRIFAWTLGALVAMHLLEHFMDLSAWVQANTLIVLLLAGVVGLIPESGPHLIFVTLYASGTIPFAILLTSSIVQDGHGTLPLLASSKQSFLRLKLLNLIVGLALGALWLLIF